MQEGESNSLTQCEALKGRRILMSVSLLGSSINVKKSFQEKSLVSSIDEMNPQPLEVINDSPNEKE